MARAWLLLGLLSPGAAHAAAAAGPRIGGIPVEFFLFVTVLVGVALFHHATLYVALGGLAVLSGFKVAFGFDLIGHLGHEAVTVANLGGLLLGFALLADHFEKSHVPNWLPRVLPDDWRGGFSLLAIVFVLSAFLDNIAAAMIGGTIAGIVFSRRVHVAYLAAIIAASNAGGSGSVVGDTTTTMMWIAGVRPWDVLHAYVAAVPAFLVFATLASRTQQAWQPISKDEVGDAHIDTVRLGIVAAMLGAAVATNITMNLALPDYASAGPWLALALWAAILVTSLVRAPAWGLLPEAAKGAVFLLSLVLCASLMPVDELPSATWSTTFGLGFVSAVFDNIPLTALALRQGGYDWGVLAYAVGFGGSMVWFGSSAGVALSSTYPDARNAAAYLRHGWPVVLGYAVGFFVLIATLGWTPHAATHAAAPPTAHGAR